MTLLIFNGKLNKTKRNQSMNKKRFVVPHDFTPVADIALSHAIATAKRVSAEIELLHVVAKDKQIADADKKLAQIISNKKSIVFFMFQTNIWTFLFIWFFFKLL